MDIAQWLEDSTELQEVTQELVVEVYRNCIPYFKGSTFTFDPDFKIVIQNSKRFYAYVMRDKRIGVPKFIGVSPSHRWTKRFLVKTMIHEMCHVVAIIKNKESGHFKNFWRLMEANGFPDGFNFENEKEIETDRYSGWDKEKFKVGEIAEWDYRGVNHYGTVIRINKRTITVDEIRPEEGRIWRCNPLSLSHVKFGDYECGCC